MSDLGVRTGRLGIGPSTAAFIFYGIRRDAPAFDLVNGAVVTEGCRGTKTAKEIAYMDLANKITKLAYREGFKSVREDMTPRDLSAAARKVVEDAGYGPGYKYFAHRIGHGIGMEGHEYPYLVKGNTLKLEPGMTFSNEPGIYIYGEFGVRTEDCMVVTAEGARHLGGMEAVSIEQPFS